MTDTETISLLWLLVCTCFALLMQAGFTLIETGSVRAKNSVNVAMKNLADFIVVTVVYIVFGFHLSQGDSLLSFASFSLEEQLLPKLLFNLMFVTTAVTIISGCVAERMSYRGYIYASIVIAALTYPVVSYWTWNPNSWLHELGFYDFAGGATVHIVGGMAGLIGTYIVGARKGRFETLAGRDIPSYSHTLVTIGVFFMLFAWLGFNGGSLYSFDLRVPKVLFNTLVSGAIAGCCALIWFHRHRHVPAFAVLNSVLGGLVIVTAGADIMDLYDLFILGFCAAACVILGEKLLIQLKIDDPVGAVPVHLFCGIVGTLYVGVKLGWTQQGTLGETLLIQALGVIAIIIWSGLNAYAIFLLLKRFSLERVTEHEEELGLNVSEHGIRMSWLDTVATIDQISKHGDYSKRVPIEFGTEAGDVAASFNHLMDRLEANIDILHQVAKGNLGELDITPSSEKDVMANSLRTMILGLKSLIDDVEGKMEHQLADQTDSEHRTLTALIERFKHTQDQLMEAEKMSALSGMVVGVAHELNTPLGISVTTLSMLNEQIATIRDRFSSNAITTDDFDQFLDTASQCMELLNTNIDRSVTLVSKLKNIDQKMAVEEPKLIALKQVFSDVLLHNQLQLAEKKIVVDVECDDDLEAILPPISLACVIEELLTNAMLHAFGDDEPEEHRRIDIHCRQAEQQTIITFADNGCGISAEYQSKIFQPFFTTLRARGGTGLGMHMVYNICTQKLRGNIELESEIGKGAQFTISLNSRQLPNE